MRNHLILIRRLIAGIVLLAAAAPAYGQVATTYTFSQSVGTYTPIAGGTIIASNAMANMDEEVFAVPIPTFYFDGTPYNSIYVSTNGFITFGSYMPDTYFYEPLSSNDPYDGAVSAFGADVNSAQAAAGTRNIMYLQVGDEFVIQWQNVRRYAVSGERISFQIRLNTATNEIAIVYGGSIIPGDDQAYPQVGLRGADNTFATNVNNREVLTGAWNTSTAGTSATSTCYFDAATPATVPTAGTRFAWTPAADLAAIRVVVSGAEGCYDQETVGLEVKNIGGTTYDFAANPVTVSSTITGVIPASLPVATINTGTLAAGATYVIPLSPGSDFSANGNYTINAALSGDLRVSNNAAVDDVMNNRPTVAYPDVTSCEGTPVTLSGTATAPSYYAVTTNSSPTVIPDDDPAGATSSIVVSNASGASIANVMVVISSLTHTYTPDLTLTLTAPDGSSVILAMEPGSGENMIGTIFSSGGMFPLSFGDNPFTGSYMPDEDFGLLTGSANGTWQLNVTDNYAFDSGSLNEWSIAFPMTNSIVSYDWTPSADLDDATIAAPLASPAASTAYTVTVTDARGCEVSDAVQLTVGTLPVVTASSDAAANTVCEGTAVTLNGGGADTYDWSGSVNDGVAFTPTVTDTYTVTGTDANGCEGTATITITVNEAPDVTASSDAPSNTVCEGTPVTLTGGGADDYDWVGVVDGVPFTPTQTDTYTVMGYSSNGCEGMATITITVNEAPDVTASSDAPSNTVCEGTPVTLTGGGADDYDWVGVVDGVPFTPTQTDTYTVMGYSSNGCEGMATITITVNEAPAVTQTPFTAVCEDAADVTLSGGSPAGGTYSGTGVTGGAFDPSAGTQMIVYTYTDANGCEGEAMETFTVNDNPNTTLAVGTDELCVYDASITLSGGAPAGGTYSGAGVSGTTFDPAAAGLGTQTVTYTFTDANGCSASATDAIDVDECLGVDENAAASLTAFPNPGKGAFTLRVSEEQQLNDVVVTDAQGKLVAAAVVQQGADVTIDLTEARDGIYFVQAQLDGKPVSVRLIKQ